MTPTEERTVIGVIERSAVVTAIERLATRMGRAARTARTLGTARTVARAAQRNLGVTIFAAVATHVALVGAVVRPVSWYWLIIPAVFVTAGALLVARPRFDGRQGE